MDISLLNKLSQWGSPSFSKKNENKIKEYLSRNLNSADDLIDKTANPNFLINSDFDSFFLNCLSLSSDIYQTCEINLLDQIYLDYGIEGVSLAKTSLDQRKRIVVGTLFEKLLEVSLQYNKITYHRQVIDNQRNRVDIVLDDFAGKKAFICCKKTIRERWKQIFDEGNEFDFRILFTLDLDISKKTFERLHNNNIKMIFLSSQIDYYQIKKGIDLNPYGILSLKSFIQTILKSQRY